MMNQLTTLSDALSRSIRPENFPSEKGSGGMATEGTGISCARDLGQGWKVSPSIIIKAGTTFEITNIDDPGTIEQIWMTPTGLWRTSILRTFWDDQEYPSAECPIGDFFACGWEKFAQVSSLAVSVNPGSAFNCYWLMPFAKRCRMTIENIDSHDICLYYQINYSLAAIPENSAYFHAQFRRTNPLPYGEAYSLVDDI